MVDQIQNYSSRTNPVVFLDFSVSGQDVGRVKIELFQNLVPKTAENFRVDGKPAGYKGSSFHRIIKGFMIQGGDIVNGDGSGTISIYGSKFDDENFALSHSTSGLVSMANSGPNTNGCQFFITCAQCEHLDGKNVIFGHVIEGMKVIRQIENVPVIAGTKPKHTVEITMCGQFS